MYFTHNIIFFNTRKAEIRDSMQRRNLKDEASSESSGGEKKSLG
jgi:hypothetical protein